ncbi:MAG: efflux RND transporter periplasmic adaptor subunit [Rhizobiales bacterium]|nr:efflux RND transporter periplasmic adaptor subunit [Hyphomicrobiales bacterium]
MPPASPRHLFIIGLVLVFAGLAWWQWGVASPTENAGEKRSDRAVPVTTYQVRHADQPITVSTLGTVEADATVNIRARIDGEIAEIAFREGDTVKKGDLLFRIDARPYEAALRRATADFARDSAQYKNAKLDYERKRKLNTKGFQSQATLDQAEAEMKAFGAAMAASQAARDLAQLDLDYTEIRAPIDGKTGPVLIDAGNFIRASNDQTLVTLRRVEPVKVRFALAQQYVARLKARLATDYLHVALTHHQAEGAVAIAEKPVTARVAFIDNQVNPDTGAIELRAIYDNRDRRLTPGEYVDLSVTIDELKSVAIVPLEAVNLGENERYVFIVSTDGPDSTVTMRPVKVLYENADIAAVEGVNDGEHVVTTGQLRLRDGARVTPTEQAVPAT